MKQASPTPLQALLPPGSNAATTAGTWHWQAEGLSPPLRRQLLKAADLQAFHRCSVFPAPVSGTLLFLFSTDRRQILLIRKLRGHGAGLINGPGGKVDPGETRLGCALREVAEELHVQPLDARLQGELRFVDEHGASVWGWVYRAQAWRGQPVATAEAEPFWCPVETIPYDAMWPGDRFWMPLVLAGISFRATLQTVHDRIVQVTISLTAGGKP